MTIVLDFKENLKLGAGPIEVGQDFYQKTQVSCLGVAVHIGGGPGVDTRTTYYDVLSYFLSHDGLYVRESLKVILPKILDDVGPISTMSFWMDCGPHFRNYEILNYCLLEVPQTYDIQNTKVNFFAEHHGKSLVDGHFGHVSRACQRYSLSKRLAAIENIAEAINMYFHDSQVQPLILPTPSRSTVTRISLREGDKLIKITQTYHYSSQLGGIFASFLSTGTPRVSCKFETNLELDTRGLKEPPNLKQRLESASSSPCMGKETGKRLQEQQRRLLESGLV